MEHHKQKNSNVNMIFSEIVCNMIFSEIVHTKAGKSLLQLAKYVNLNFWLGNKFGVHIQLSLEISLCGSIDFL